MKISEVKAIIKFYLTAPTIRIEKIGKLLSRKQKQAIPDIFNPRRITYLCLIMKMAGSDKGLRGHHYTPFYSAIFPGNSRLKVKKVFELGVGTNNLNFPDNMGINGNPGASLRGWRLFFPKAKIFGADIDKDVLIQEQRISTYYCDVLNIKSINALWRKNPDLFGKFDLIIDDGLHTFKANTLFFENSIKKLKRGGVFIVEDVKNNEIPKWKRILPMYIKKYPDLIFSIFKVPHRSNPTDNTLFVAEKRY